MSIHRLLIGTRIEIHQEFRPPQMKNKLRENTEFWRQTERGGIVLSEGGEFGTQSD